MSMIETDGDFGLYSDGRVRIRAVAKYPDMGPTRQPEPSDVEDTSALRRFEMERKARDERERVRRERGRALHAGAPSGGQGTPFSREERAIVHRLAAENPEDSPRMLCGRFQAETSRPINPQTVKNILLEPPPGDADAEAARPRIPRQYPADPAEEPVDPPADDVTAAIGEIDAILKWLPPGDRSRVRAWFADANPPG